MQLRKIRHLVFLLLLAVTPLLLSGCVLDSLLGGGADDLHVAVVNASPMQGTAPLTVSFEALYAGNPDMLSEMRWNFGDPMHSQPSVGQTATHTFTHPGTYMVKLTLVSKKGTAGIQWISIEVDTAPPIAVASVNRTEPLPGDPVTFVATDSYDLYGEVVSYRWDFGDGGIGWGQTTTHTYSEHGTYYALLTVTNSSGKTAQTRLQINVKPGRMKDPDENGSAGQAEGRRPLALIILSDGISCGINARVGDTIRFSGEMSRPVIGSIVSYEWDFGDGHTASGSNVRHQYTRPWTYTVTLTVTDEEGNQGVATISLSIGGAICSL